MQLENLGNAIQIGIRKLPAVNIQLEETNIEHDYGTYFEVPIETGALVVVHKPYNGEKISMEAYPFWQRNKEVMFNITLVSWESFLQTFDSFVSWCESGAMLDLKLEENK
jgi:hypothetical protein